jgi:hypothetical protein
VASWLALDLSLSSTGYALWRSGDERATLGHWMLAEHSKWQASGFVRLHRFMLDLHREGAIDNVVSEEPLSQAALKGNTTISTIRLQVGLAAHVMSFAKAVKATHVETNISSWRRHFIGKIPRGTKTPDLKALAFTRARELGFDPACHDESDALGILDHNLSSNGVIPPWRAGSILQRELTPAKDGRAARGACL